MDWNLTLGNIQLPKVKFQFIIFIYYLYKYKVMSNAEKIQSRFDKLTKLQQFYETQQKKLQFLKIISLLIIGFSWILTLFLKFTLPFFFLQSLGVFLWIYCYISTNYDLLTWKNYLTDPIILVSSIIMIINSIYVLIAAGHCSMEHSINNYLTSANL